MGAQKSSRPDGVFLAHMLVLAVLALVLYLMYVVVLDAMMNHKQAEVDRKRNEKLRNEVETVLKDIRKVNNASNSSGDRSKPDQ